MNDENTKNIIRVSFNIGYEINIQHQNGYMIHNITDVSKNIESLKILKNIGLNVYRIIRDSDNNPKIIETGDINDGCDTYLVLYKPIKFNKNNKTRYMIRHRYVNINYMPLHVEISKTGSML